jgi:hypothetical protein
MVSRDLSAHLELRAHLNWLIAQIQTQAPALQSEDFSSQEEVLRRSSFVYLLSSLGATVYEFLWSEYYRKNVDAASGPDFRNPSAIKTDSELLGAFLKDGLIDVETHRALRQMNDFRNLIKRPYDRIEWETISSVEWHLEHVAALLKTVQ